MSPLRSINASSGPRPWVAKLLSSGLFCRKCLILVQRSRGEYVVQGPSSGPTPRSQACPVFQGYFLLLLSYWWIFSLFKISRGNSDVPPPPPTLEMLSVTSQSSSKWRSFFKNKKSCRDFSGSPVVKNPLSTAEDAGSIPGQGTEISYAAGELSQRAVTRGSLYTATKSSAAKDK